MTNEARPNRVKRTLSTGETITVGKISWDGWRKVKTRMLEALSASEIGRALSSILNLWAGEKPTTDNLDEYPDFTEMDVEEIEAWQEQHPELVPGLHGKDLTLQEMVAKSDLVEVGPAALSLLNRALDDMTCDLLEDCIEGQQPERLGADDALELRDAVFEVNDFGGLLGKEKNSLTALVTGAMGAAANTNMKNSSQSSGSSTGNHS